MYNYKINIFWSEKDKAFIATCPEFEGLAVVADSRAQALKEAEETLQAYIEIYKEDGMALPAPETAQEYSGQIRVRLPKSMHAEAARQAADEGISLNQFICLAIEAKTSKAASAQHVVMDTQTMSAICESAIRKVFETRILQSNMRFEMTEKTTYDYTTRTKVLTENRLRLQGEMISADTIRR